MYLLRSLSVINHSNSKYFQNKVKLQNHSASSNFSDVSANWALKSKGKCVWCDLICIFYTNGMYVKPYVTFKWSEKKFASCLNILRQLQVLSQQPWHEFKMNPDLSSWCQFLFLTYKTCWKVGLCAYTEVFRYTRPVQSFLYPSWGSVGKCTTFISLPISIRGAFLLCINSSAFNLHMQSVVVVLY